MDVFQRLSAFNHVKISKILFAAGKPEEYLKASSKCNMFATYVFSKNTCFLNSACPDPKGGATPLHVVYLMLLQIGKILRNEPIFRSKLYPK